jgi:peptidylprolyl isomerase
MSFEDLVATSGKTIRLRYTILLDDGKAYPPKGPEDVVEVELGRDRLLPGLEAAVEGMKAGEKKRIRLPAEQAFGPHRPEFCFRISRSADRPVRVGDAVRIAGGAGGEFLALVREIEPAAILVDANHPLSGQDLTFELTLLDVTPRGKEAALLAC